MREIVLDTETTGFDPESGDRIVEIGAVELVRHVPTGATYHQYINPERSMPEDAFQVHGLGDDFLRDKPVFKAVAQEFLDFIGDAKLVIHNASFDMKFLNAELGWLGLQKIDNERAIDTLAIARRKLAGDSLTSACRILPDRHKLWKAAVIGGRFSVQKNCPADLAKTSVPPMHSLSRPWATQRFGPNLADRRA